MTRKNLLLALASGIFSYTDHYWLPWRTLENSTEKMKCHKEVQQTPVVLLKKWCFWRIWLRNLTPVFFSFEGRLLTYFQHQAVGLIGLPGSITKAKEMPPQRKLLGILLRFSYLELRISLPSKLLFFPDRILCVWCAELLVPTENCAHDAFSGASGSLSTQTRPSVPAFCFGRPWKATSVVSLYIYLLLLNSKK